MATKESKPAAVAIAPRSIDQPAVSTPPQATMPFTCTPCARRKVKCDKTVPSCSTCRRCRIDCSYQAPAPRSRKRKPSDPSSEALEKVARYEDILRRHGLLESGASPETGHMEEPVEDPIFPLWNASSEKLLVDGANSRYINSHAWRNLGNDEMELVAKAIHDEETEGDADLEGKGPPVADNVSQQAALDPLSGAFLLMGSRQSLLQYRPSSESATILWNTHVEHVEPLCRVLHIPSTTKTVSLALQQPALSPKTDECLLFAIYHFAVYSMLEEDCLQKLGEPRHTLLARYSFATRQALINTSFLKTTAMPVLQALVLFLLACKQTYDPQTFWILTGVASRIAQRIGLHRDGETLGLPPFEVQMRRRLFFQIISLDGTASRMSGVAVSLPDLFDTKLPLNINDDQIWPGMTESPKELEAATDMIFCLSRACLGSMLAKKMKKGEDGNIELVIKEAECVIEEKYVRYCDIVNPLHMLTMGMSRAGIAAMRLRVRLSKVKDNTASDDERKELFRLAEKILDTDTATRACVGLSRFRWYLKGFFLWGMWDSIIYILMTLRQQSHLLTTSEIDAAWHRLGPVCLGHIELFMSKQALYVAAGRLMLKAWASSKPGASKPEFIANLCDHHEGLGLGKAQREQKKSNTDASFESMDGGPSNSGLLGAEDSVLPPNTSPKASSNFAAIDFEFDDTDWMFWDQLLQDPLAVQEA
jgi:transcription factor-like protein/Zn(2)-Cys(6) binuclear cluster domain-containing protein